MAWLPLLHGRAPTGTAAYAIEPFDCANGVQQSPRQTTCCRSVIPKSFLYVDTAKRISGGSLRQARPPTGRKLRSLLRKVARRRCLKRRTAALMNETDLERLAALLTENTSPTGAGTVDGAERVDYDSFCAVRGRICRNARPFFTARSFLRFRRDQWGRISAHVFFRHVCRFVALGQTRIQLNVYDTLGHGWLREQDLENYLYELIPSLPSLSGLQENFYPFYVFTAVRKFFFFLDPRRTGKVRVVDVLESPILAELLELRDSMPAGGDVGPAGTLPPTANEPAQGMPQRSWFSARNALRVYSQYLDLDTDHNGMLSECELGAYGLGTLTNVFIERVFQASVPFLISICSARRARNIGVALSYAHSLCLLHFRNVTHTTAKWITRHFLILFSPWNSKRHHKHSNISGACWTLRKWVILTPSP